MKYALLWSALLFSSLAIAAGPKSYQVTGPVVEVRNDVIIVQKSDEKWEISRDKDTKGGADIKVGDKVSVQYTMSAKSITRK